MAEALTVIFASPWHFAGTVVLIEAVAIPLARVLIAVIEREQRRWDRL
jgi:hypothetical protein